VLFATICPIKFSINLQTALFFINSG
jgi:hypothetical protein